jgi:hypothetical protein
VKSVHISARRGIYGVEGKEDEMTRDNEVKIGNGSETRIITMRHPPRPGEYLEVDGEMWEVLSVSYEIPYRIPAMSFIIRREAG